MQPDKLNRLPRNQRLRKIAKIFAEAENRIFSAASTDTANINTTELLNFRAITEALASDQLFSQTVREEFKYAAGIFQNAGAQNVMPGGDGTAELRRALNGVRHLLLAETGRSQADWDFTGGDGHLDPEKRRVFAGMQVYLEDIRSPFNVGAMFRSAESFGAEKIFLSRFCADPNHVRARRTAMGCVEVIPWERRELFTEPKDAPGIEEAAGTEQSAGIEQSANIEQEPIPVFAMETGGTPLSEFLFPSRGLLIAGSEELGVSPRALAIADASLGRVSIPCYGAKGSLNVSVAFGIVMQAWAQALICNIKL